MVTVDDSVPSGWQFLLLADDIPDGVPAAVAVACRSVGRDLRCAQDGGEIDVDQMMWTVQVKGEGSARSWRVGWVARGRYDSTAMDSGWLHVALDDQPAVTVHVAETVQKHLAVHGSVQWPSGTGQLLQASARGLLPAWIAPRTGRIVSRIGALCSPVSNR